MDLNEFNQHAKLSEMTELGRAEHIVFFLTRDLPIHECSIQDVINSFKALHYSVPNSSRMKKNAIKSGRFVRASSEQLLKLHARSVSDLRAKFPDLTPISEKIATKGSLIPTEIYSGAVAYVKRLADQVNACYENRIYDGCAVLMRRLLEILLIKTYEKLGLQDRIRGAEGNYKMLEAIVSDAKSGNHLSLSRNTKERLDDFRALGNFAAHKIEFLTRKGDIDKISLDYRAAIEELLTKSELTQ